MRARLAAACLLALVAAGCGGDDEDSADAQVAADLTVTVRPQGPDGPARRRTIRCERVGRDAESDACRTLGADRLAPVPRDVACTQVYGGDAVARVTGELNGKPVDASFALTNGCEIERWDRNRALLDDAPG